jgi:hypothetical protein
LSGCGQEVVKIIVVPAASGLGVGVFLFWFFVIYCIDSCDRNRHKPFYKSGKQKEQKEYVVKQLEEPLVIQENGIEHTIKLPEEPEVQKETKVEEQPKIKYKRRGTDISNYIDNRQYQ